ncbi:MAG TPA: SPOR domain-containing protein [Azospirillum sp.]|nr:SPOR domain-containing protein [Azospirillum sp.]
MTFKDEIKAADAKASEGRTDTATPSDNDDIARLLRALNEDLKADPRAVPTDEDVEGDEEDAEAGSGRHFPLGKIALALLAAGGVGIGVVMFDGSTSDAPPAQTATQTAQVAPVAPGGASPASPPPLTLNPKPAGSAAPESLIARAPAPGPAPAAPAATAPAPVPPIPAPPGRVEPAPVPPPVLPAAPSGTQTVVKPIEPPAIPKLDAPKPAEAKAPVAKPADTRAAEVKPAEPKAPELFKIPEPKAPEPKAAETKAAETKAAEPAPPPAEAKAPEGNAADLQAMLAPPKPAQPAAKAGKAKAAPAAAPTAPAAPSAPRPAASVSGRWMVQAGSFSVVENAEAVVRKLAAKGYSAQVIDWTDAAQRSWKVVRVGGYDNPAEAKRVAGELKSVFGLSPMVVSGR